MNRNLISSHGVSFSACRLGVCFREKTVCATPRQRNARFPYRFPYAECISCMKLVPCLWVLKLLIYMYTKREGGKRCSLEGCRLYWSWFYTVIHMRKLHRLTLAPPADHSSQSQALAPDRSFFLYPHDQFDPIREKRLAVIFHERKQDWCIFFPLYSRTIGRVFLLSSCKPVLPYS